MSEFNPHYFEPIFSRESEEQYRARISNIDALKLASEKRIWERKKLAEINKVKAELDRILQHEEYQTEMYLHHCKLSKTLNNTKQPTVMKNETITIEAPEGHVIDKENSTDTVIRFKKVESNKRPMSFDELKHIEGFYITSLSNIDFHRAEDPAYGNKATWPTKKLAEAALALSQLLQLRDAWNEMTQDDYVLDRLTNWYSIGNKRNEIDYAQSSVVNYSLRFKSMELRDGFIKQFRPLIETALPLL